MITDFTTIRRVAETALSSSYTETDIKYENVGLELSVNEFVALRDSAQPSALLAIGQEETHVGGVLLVDIFTEAGTGTQRARVIANAVDIVLGAQEIGPVSFGASALHTVGETKDAILYHHVLQIPYQYISGIDFIDC